MSDASPQVPAGDTAAVEPATQACYTDRFAGKVALVTGGAQGMGRAIAMRFAAEGGSVVLADLELEKGTSLADELGRATAVRCDVTQREDAESAVETAIAEFGRLDAVFNCAGGALFPPVPFWDLQEDVWEKLLDVNLKGQWLINKAAAPALQERGGKIVGISSIDALDGSAGLAAYASAKGGVLALTKSLARELGPFNVTVNAIAPSFIRVEHPKAVLTGDRFKTVVADAVSQQCIKRVGETSDIADVATFLASSDADFVTGQVIAVNGGSRFH
jgi:NAD(P)-dependent dehydrogenase (short-subunit alcohol dehydrogenase family)